MEEQQQQQQKKNTSNNDSTELDINNLLEAMQNESDTNITPPTNNNTIKENNSNRIKNNNIPLKDNHTTTTATRNEINLKSWDQALEDVLDQMKLNKQTENSFTIDNNNLIINQVNNNNNNIKVWWFDAYEKIDKGHVYLFGKVNINKL